MFAQESVMDVQKMPTLAEKQEFWVEQLPNFEATYWLPSHFEYVIFDMEQGNYVIKDDLSPDFEDDATEIWHRVNTGWAMWKKAINFGRKQPQAVPEGFVLVPKEIPKSFDEGLYFYSNSISVVNEHSDGFIPMSDIDHSEIWKLVIEAQEPTND